MNEPETHFQCRACGACCRWPGIVRIRQNEIARIAEFLQLSEESFLAQYTCVAPDRKSLILTGGDEEPCIFLTENNLCRIHPVKPLQCKTFPEGWTVPPEFRKLCKGMENLPYAIPKR